MVKGRCGDCPGNNQTGGCSCNASYSLIKSSEEKRELFLLMDFSKKETIVTFEEKMTLPNDKIDAFCESLKQLSTTHSFSPPLNQFFSKENGTTVIFKHYCFIPKTSEKAFSKSFEELLLNCEAK